MTTIAILGAGRMGTAITRAFLAQGRTVHVWNRTAERSAPLADQGARVARSVSEAVAAAEVVIGILSDYPTSDALLRSPDVTAALRGKLFVQLASGSPAEARAGAAWAKQHGVRYLDGAIMASPDFIGQPECLLLYAGERALFDAYDPLLRQLGGATAYVGSDPGHAAVLDSALLVFLWGVLFGALQGVAISRAEGLPLEAYLAHLKTVLPVSDALAPEVVDRALRSDYEQTQATLDTHHAALQHALAICREHDLDRTIPDAFDRLMRRGRDRGFGQLDFTALLQVLR